MRFDKGVLRRLLFAAFCVALTLAAVTARAEEDIAALLAGRLEQDSALKTRAIELRQAELTHSETTITNGFSVKLNTGALLFRFDGEGTFQAEPTITLELPAANNAALTVSAPLTAGGGAAADTSNTTFTLSADITGNSRKKRTVELLQAGRAVTEARRALQKRALEVEKEFYQALRGLYEQEAALYTKNETRWTEELEFTMVRAQGYDESSAAYRAARMELAKAEREAAEAERRLRRDIAVFARDCGRESMDALPRSVPAPSSGGPEEGAPEGGGLLSLAGFDRSRYTELESARWRRYINTLSREADGELGVRLEGGGTLNNTAFQSGTDGGTHSLNAGASLSWRGITLSGGLEFPLGGGGGSPALKLSVGLDSETLALAPLKRRQDALAAQKELIEIENSGKTWDDLLASTDRERSDLLWQRRERAEQFELYGELEADMLIWFEQGVIPESEYRRAEANRENARYNCLITDTDMILYQIEISLYLIME
ncbi:MAG: hypothetical protein LBF83_11265 [Spirochaetaceae bacterium]|jgi:hypothetical protein|nr:hypothetical protein [Spirochaetaceae bacterium]